MLPPCASTLFDSRFGTCCLFRHHDMREEVRRRHKTTNSRISATTSRLSLMELYFSPHRKAHGCVLVLSCLVLPCLVLSCLVLSCRVAPCRVLSCLVLSCLVLRLSCLVICTWRLRCAYCDILVPEKAAPLVFGRAVRFCRAWDGARSHKDRRQDRQPTTKRIGLGSQREKARRVCVLEENCLLRRTFTLMSPPPTRQ